MHQGIIHHNLHDAADRLRNAGGDAQRHRAAHQIPVRPAVGAAQAHMARVAAARPQEIQGQHNGGDDLRGDRGNRRALDAPVQDEYVDGVEDCVQESADHHAVHGHARMAVRACQVGQHDRYHVKGRAEQDDRGVVERVRQDGIGRAERAQQGAQEDQAEDHQHDAEQNGKGERGVERALGLLLVLFPQTDGCVRAAARADQGGERQQDGHDRKGDRCRGVAQITDALPDEDLVHDVVNRVDQAGDDGGEGEGHQQTADRLAAERVLGNGGVRFSLQGLHGAALLSGRRFPSACCRSAPT